MNFVEVDDCDACDITSFGCVEVEVVVVAVTVGARTSLRGRPGPLLTPSDFLLATDATVVVISVLLISAVFSSSSNLALWTLALYAVKFGHDPFCHDLCALPQLQHDTAFLGQSLVW